MRGNDLRRSTILPLSFESFGGWAPEALHFFQELSRRTAAACLEPMSEVHPRFMQRLSMAIWRGISRCILSKIAGTLADDQDCFLAEPQDREKQQLAMRPYTPTDSHKIMKVGKSTLEEHCFSSSICIKTSRKM